MPISILIKPASSMCNMRCKYCFYADVSEHRSVKNHGIMSLGILETIVRSAFEYASDGPCNFAFQGGEPTMCGLDFYKYLIKFQDKYNTKKIPVTNAIQTNGYCINDNWAKFFADNNFLVGLSLDGPKNVHDLYRHDSAGKGTWNTVTNTASLFNKYKVEFNILCVVNNIVAKKGASIYNFYKKNNFRYIQFIPCLDSFDDDIVNDFSLDPKCYEDFLKTTFNLYYNDFKNNNYISIRTFDNYVSMILGQHPECCGMSGVCTSYFVIESDGSVYPCDFYVLDKYKMGNINTQNFSQLAKAETAKTFVKQSYFVDDKCKKCKWLQICRGGCRRNREPMVDEKLSLNQFCTAYKNFFSYAADKLKEIAQIVYTNTKTT